MRVDWTRMKNWTSDLRSKELEKLDFWMAEVNMYYVEDVAVERAADADADVDDDVAGDGTTGADCLAEKKSMRTAWEVTKRTSRS